MTVYLDSVKRPGEPILCISFPFKENMKDIIQSEVDRFNRCRWKHELYGELNTQPIKIEEG